MSKNNAMADNKPVEDAAMKQEQVGHQPKSPKGKRIRGYQLKNGPQYF